MRDREVARRGPWLAGILWLVAAAQASAAGPAFEVSYPDSLTPGPVTARTYVFVVPATSLATPRNGPDWVDTQPFFAVDAVDWKAGAPLRIDAAADGFPEALDRLPAGKYRAQAVVRLNPDTHRIGNGAGNAFGPVVAFDFDPASDTVIRLAVDTLVPPREFKESDRIKLVDIPSPLLSAFHGREIRLRAGVVLPPGFATASPDTRWPVLYIITGFGGDHFAAFPVSMGAYGAFGRDFIRVVLDSDCGTGHHVFADSATNGPRGEALIRELIPEIERRFPAIAEPGGRLLTGHSSGGWSSLWLQVRYPEVFGGVWSTAPDPLDFRDFQRINLYQAGVNAYRDEAGNRRPIARRGEQPFLWYDRFCRMDDVIGHGGQLGSFEAVFSPRGPDGKPRKLWDRATGTVDPETARAWEAYDIRLVLERNWPELAPKLKGKLHVYTGSLDTFYLEGAVVLLKEALARLGSDAEVEVIPGKDHGSVIDRTLSEKIDRSMRRAIAGYRPDLAEPATPAEKKATGTGP